jgi:hypothetical protein
MIGATVYTAREERNFLILLGSNNKEQSNFFYSANFFRIKYCVNYSIRTFVCKLCLSERKKDVYWVYKEKENDKSSYERER